MSHFLKMSITAGIFCLLSAGIQPCGVWAQSSTSTASAPSADSLRMTDQGPNPFEIRQQFLTIEQAALERELLIVQRCLKSAARNLRDSKGQINRASQAQLVSCNRRLQRLQRKLVRLGREGEQLAREAQAQAAIARSLSSLSSSGMSSSSSQ